MVANSNATCDCESKQDSTDTAEREKTGVRRINYYTRARGEYTCKLAIEDYISWGGGEDEEDSGMSVRKNNALREVMMRG